MSVGQDGQIELACRYTSLILESRRFVDFLAQNCNPSSEKTVLHICGNFALLCRGRLDSEGVENDSGKRTLQWKHTQLIVIH